MRACHTSRADQDSCSFSDKMAELYPEALNSMATKKTALSTTGIWTELGYTVSRMRALSRFRSGFDLGSPTLSAFTLATRTSALIYAIYSTRWSTRG